ncbi:MAG TPA: DUF4381 family protein [Longimicrobiales bacterium]
MKRILLLLLLSAVLPVSARAQSVATGLSRDTVRVGDPVRVILRIEGVPANADIILPDTLATIEDMENGGRLRMRRDTTADGLTRITAAYPVILWRPGEAVLPSIPMQVRTEGRERTMQIALPTINVFSVLPADTSNIEVKPAKDVWGANRVWWPIVLLLLLLIALAALAYWWYRRRKQADVLVPDVPVIDPRQRALQQLQQIREQRLIEHGHYKQHYILLSEALRSFAAALEPDWSTDLTTDELSPRLKRRAEASALLRLLRSADTVKFARYQPNPTEARTDLDDAIGWVGSFNRREEPPAEAA